VSDFTDEQVRILRAAADGRLNQNEHGRWIIADERRPERKDRVKLLNNGFITWPHYRTRETLTARGRAALDALDAKAGAA
jgi:hypothetical protein